MLITEQTFRLFLLLSTFIAVFVISTTVIDFVICKVYFVMHCLGRWDSFNDAIKYKIAIYLAK